MLMGELKAWRTLLTLTQAEAAVQLGVSIAQYSNYERGKAPIPRKIEVATAAVTMSRAEMVKKVDGRFKKPVDYEALGRPVTLYLEDGNVAHEFMPDHWHGRKGDPSFRPRAKTLADALALVQHWRVKVSEERADGYHIWLA